MAAFLPVLRRRRNNGTGTSSLGGEPQRGDNKQTNRRSSRLVGLVILTLIGMWLLGEMTALAAHAMSMQTHAIAGQAFPATSPSPRLDKLQRRQAGGVQAPSQKLLAQTLMVAAFCLPTDLPCLLNTAMQWATQQLVSVFQPLIDAINRSPLNFITQTPICVSACPTQQSPYPQNATIGTLGITSRFLPHRYQ